MNAQQLEKFFDDQTEALIGRLRAAGEANKPQLPKGPFSTKDYATFCHRTERTARERIQRLRERGIIRLHLWVHTTYGRVAYYTAA